MYYIEHVTYEMGFCSSFQLILCVLFPPLPLCCTADYHPRTLQWDTDPSVLQLQSDSELGYMSALFVICLSFICKNYVENASQLSWFYIISFALLTQKDHNLSFLLFSFINKKLQQSHLCGKTKRTQKLFREACEKISCYFCCLKHNTNNNFITDEMLLLWHLNVHVQLHCSCLYLLIQTFLSESFARYFFSSFLPAIVTLFPHAVTISPFSLGAVYVLLIVHLDVIIVQEELPS